MKCRFDPKPEPARVTLEGRHDATIKGAKDKRRVLVVRNFTGDTVTNGASIKSIEAYMHELISV